MKMSLRLASAAGACCALGLLAAPQVAKANVYAAHLNAPASVDFGSSSSIEISYRLNEPATSVSVEIFETSAPGTVVKTIAGGTAWGLNTVNWDGSADGGGNAASGTYGFRVVASDDGHGSWTNITPIVGGNEIGSAQYYAPQGVAVINDIDSPDFGCILVANGWPAPSSEPGAEANQQGVYVLYNDMSWYGGSVTTAYAAGKNNPNNRWDPTDDWCPWKIKFGKDETRYYLGDSGTTGVTDDVWTSTGPSGSTATAVLRYDAANHGRIEAIKSVGTGSSRKLYGLDRDQHGTGFRSMWRWDVGDTLDNFTGGGTRIMSYLSGENPTGSLAYTMRDLDIGASSGDLYVTNARQSAASYNEPRVFRCSLDATTLRWKKTGTDIKTMDGSLTNIPSTHGIAVDEARDRMAVLCDGAAANDGGKVIIMDPDDGSIRGWFVSGATGSARAVAWDAAGNLYTSNQTDEHVRMWAAPDGANNFTTPYTATFSVTAAPSGDTTPPAIVTAVSRKIHGTVGSFDVDIAAAGAVEGRVDGPTQIVVEFDEAIVRAGAANDVTVSSGTISSITVAGSTLTVDLSGAADQATLSVGFAGIEDAAGNAVTATLCMGVLLGDTASNGGGAPDSVVNIYDIIAVKGALDKPANSGNFTNDVCGTGNTPADGVINIYDIIAVKGNLDKTAPACP